MSPLIQQSIEAWQVNNRINLMILDELSAEALASTLSTRGGRTVAVQFAHMHNVRLQWLEVSVPAIYKTQTKLNTEGNLDAALLKKTLTASANAVAEWMGTADDGGKLKGYKKGVIFLLSYICA